VLLSKVAPKVSGTGVSCMSHSGLLEKYCVLGKMLNNSTNHMIWLLALQCHSKLRDFYDDKSSSTALLVKYICSTERKANYMADVAVVQQ